MLEDIERAAQRETRRLMNMLVGASTRPVMLFTNGEMARRALRIEIDRDSECVVMEALWRSRMIDPGQQRDRIGPMQIMGIDCYVVDRLAAPGWRIINPFYKA